MKKIVKTVQKQITVYMRYRVVVAVTHNEWCHFYDHHQVPPTAFRSMLTHSGCSLV